MNINEAIALLKANGYRVTKSKPKTKKDRVGPTFVARFADGEITRMSTCTNLDCLNWTRGQRLARIAWAARHNVSFQFTTDELEKMCPPINECHFEQDGVMLGEPLRRAA